MLEALDLPYTGVPAAAWHLTCNKPLAKEHLRAAGLPTADWAVADGRDDIRLPPPYIIKAVWEHASLGPDDHAVIADGTYDALLKKWGLEQGALRSVPVNAGTLFSK